MNATLARLTRLSDPPAADGALLDAFLAGDEGAFAALVRRHAGLVFATCRRILRHQQDAEDAFQATFLVLARRAADVWPREALGAWLFGVAHRVALKARAVRTRRAAREHPLEDTAGAVPTGPECDLAEAVHRAVCRLPEVYRAAVVACDLEGLSRKEAAERLGWPEGTLSGRLARARELLATRFRRAGLTLPAGGLTALFAAPEVAPAATVRATIDLATGAAASAAAPVAALCEGMVRSMGLVKLKMATAAVLVACTVGYGAFAAGPGGDQKPVPGAKPPLSPARPAAKAEPPAPPADPARKELDALRVEIEQAAKNKLDKAVLDKLRAQLDATEKLLEAKAEPPAKLDPSDPTLLEARKALKEAEDALREAEARAREAQAVAERYAVHLKAVRERVEALEARGLKSAPAVGAAEFAIHVRSLTAAEKVTRVKLSGGTTVLDALAHAGVALKPDAVSAWVVRDGAVLPIDLPGIVKNGEIKTNYALKAGDGLFIQVKPAK